MLNNDGRHNDVLILRGRWLRLFACGGTRVAAHWSRHLAVPYTCSGWMRQKHNCSRTLFRPGHLTFLLLDLSDGPWTQAAISLCIMAMPLSLSRIKLEVRLSNLFCRTVAASCAIVCIGLAVQKIPYCSCIPAEGVNEIIAHIIKWLNWRCRKRIQLLSAIRDLACQGLGVERKWPIFLFPTSRSVAFSLHRSLPVNFTKTHGQLVAAP